MKNITRVITIVILTLGSIYPAMTQGVSFSYLIPSNGYLSAPVSPFSIRGVGLDFGLIGIETGFTLYSIPGLPLTDLPFESKKPMIGPSFATLVPAQLSLGVDTKTLSVRLLGGGFGIWNINPRINYGNMDRAIRHFEGWDVANSDFEIENNIGLGWMAGLGFEIHVSQKLSLTAEVQYLSGAMSSALTGSYSGGNEGDVIMTRNVSYEEAKTLLEGIEISLGASFN